MNIEKTKKAFTFIELIVVIIILGILSTIWTMSYIDSIADSRDSQRKSDLVKVWSALKIYKQKRGYFPLPWDKFNISYSWSTVAYQWYLNTDVRLNTLDNLPFDPKINQAYIYSIVTNKQEYELTATLENSENNISLKNSTYKSVSKNILPTITFATNQTIWTNIEIKPWTTEWDTNRELFIYNNQPYNLAYTFIKPYEPISDWISFTWLLNIVENNNTYWQNTDFRNCIEINESWKLLIPLSSEELEYQIITDTWALINTGCTL